MSRVYRAIESFYASTEKREMATFHLINSLSLSELFEILKDEALLKNKLAGLRLPRLSADQQKVFAMMQGELIHV